MIFKNLSLAPNCLVSYHFGSEVLILSKTITLLFFISGSPLVNVKLIFTKPLTGVEILEILFKHITNGLT